MTQPVQEPSSDRELAAIGWRTRQLARRPAIVAADSASGPKAYAYAVTFNGETVNTTGGSQFINDSPWDETYTNPAAEVTRAGDSGQIFEPQIDDGQIFIRPGAGIAMTCVIKVVVGWLTSGEPAADELAVGIEVSSGLGFSASPTWWDTVRQVSLDPNAMQAYTHMETFYGGEVSPTDQWVRAMVDAATTGAANNIDTYQAGLFIQEIESWPLLDGTFGPGT